MKSDLKSTILKNPFVPILYTLINSGILKILVRKNGSSLLSNKKNKKKQKKLSGMTSFSFLTETAFFSVQILTNCKFCLKDLGVQNVLANLPSFGSL